MKIFGQGAMSYFLSRMSYFPYFMILTEGWRKLNISVRKSVAFLFPLLATFARTLKVCRTLTFIRKCQDILKS